MHGSLWSFVGVVAPRLMSDGTNSGAGGGKAGGSFGVVVVVTVEIVEQLRPAFTQAQEKKYVLLYAGSAILESIAVSLARTR